MKYSLIVGYSTTEMHESYPTCRISIDDRLITEFKCDNESLSNINFDFTLTILKKKGKQDPVEYINVRSTNTSFLTPCKFHIIEIDSSNLRNDMPIRLELSSNPSNYTNGFVTKRNMVCLRPIYLIPNNLLYAKDKLKKFLKKSHFISKDIADTRQNYLNKWNWPGFYDRQLLDYHGGNTKLSFTVKKKKNFFFLEHTLPEILEIKGQNRSENNWGFPTINPFFYAWIDFFTKSSSEHKCVLQDYIEKGKRIQKLESYEIMTTLREKKP